ncbi:MAG: type III-A CRISPR-associated protein Cas10/Csm1, partial [Culicoidibacterales bacterium]
QAAKLKLEQAQAKVTASLYEQFNTRLGIVFGAVELTDVQLQQKYGKSLQQVKDQIVEKKDQRFKQLMMENDATFFVKAIPHADETLCELCAVQRTCHTRCQMCELLVQLGELITTGINYTIEFDFSLKNQVKKSVFAIEIPQIGIITLHNEVETTTEYALVINQAKQGLKVKTIGNALPTSNGETLSFEAVAATAKGGNRLGVLKMDVDNLGFTFALGFTQEQQSISRITTMSRQFEWFFTSYINVICENVSEELDYDENIFYITYAGGDDLLVVGPWNAMLYLAQAIQREFSDFTYNHPQLTLSAGLAIMKPKQPIRIAAKEANAALTAAKLAPNKNAISVLDAVFPWSAQYEWSFEQLLEDFEYFSEQVEQKTVSNTLFYNLAMISTQTSGTTFSATDYVLVPNIAYAMKRNLDVRSEVYQELKQRLLIADHTNQLPYIQYPFKLVILSQRS